MHISRVECVDGETSDRNAIAGHRRRWRRESYQRLGVIVAVAVLLWVGLGGLPSAIAGGRTSGAIWRALREPILAESQALSIIATILTIIAALSVTLVLGTRIDEAKTSDLVRISGWLDAAALSMTALAALAFALAGSLLVTDLSSSGAWVAGVLAVVCLVIAVSTWEDRMGLEARGALGPIDLVRQERMRTALAGWGVGGACPHGRLVLVSVAVPLASSALATIPAVLLEPESLTGGYWVWAAVVQLVFWFLASIYLFTASAVVWLFRALERPRGAEAARAVGTLGVGVFIGPPFASSLASDALGFWLIYVAIPFVAIVALSYMPLLRGFNPYYWSAWVIVLPPMAGQAATPEPDEAGIEGGGEDRATSSVPTAAFVAASAGLALGIVAAALTMRVGRETRLLERRS